MEKIVTWLTLGLSAVAAVFVIISFVSNLLGKTKAKREQKKAEKELVHQMKEELSKKIAELKKGK